MTQKADELNNYVVVVAPVGRDAQLICENLVSVHIACQPYAKLRDVPRDTVAAAAALLTAEEALDPASIQHLASILETQPPWSDFPTIVLTGSGASTHSSTRMSKMREPLGNVTLLERPLRAVTLVSAARTALRARERQFQMRDYLAERKLILAELERSHANLESKVSQRTQALRDLSQRILRLQDEERRRIARDLHDSTGQVLTALKIQLSVHEQTFKGSPSARKSLADMTALADQALREIRTMSYLLHPPTLDHSGFISAARWYIDGVAERSGIEMRCDLTDNQLRLPDTVEMVLFRSLQESLTNIVRHANAKRVKIRFAATHRSAILEVEDDGNGISPELLTRLQSMKMNQGVGLAGMRERIQELNGEFELNSGEEGTTVKVKIPLGSNRSAKTAQRLQ
jgi:signal transduction histidine kinase